jgi:hypothetical protein
MYNKTNFQPVNWMDGMKMNKNHFLSTDAAHIDANRDTLQALLSPVSYGLIPTEDRNLFNLSLSIDNQHVIKAKLLSLEAVTQGGCRISIHGDLDKNFTSPEISQAGKSGESGLFWVSVSINLFERTPIGSPDPQELPPRNPYTLPTYTLHITADAQLKQLLQNPNQFIVGKVSINGSQSNVEEEYIPAAHTVSAHPDLVAFHAELDSFFGKLELKCSQIIQKIFKKNQQNELSDLVQFLCDRMMLYIGSNLTSFRWSGIHQSPINMIEQPVALARVIKNTIDLRIGSGKEEMMNYLAEWCDLNQGELETLLTSIAGIQYQHHDINQHINKIVQFLKVLGKLFDALSNLEFIGKKKDSNIFVKEEQLGTNTEDINKPKPKRRFFAD